LFLVENTLKDIELDASLLALEITEATLMNNKESSIKIANAIRNLGVRVAIDDFGSGYSSLNYLTHLPMDFIKLDKIFIDEICTEPKIVSVVRLAIELGKTLDYKAIAEGVETKEQLDILKKLGCHYIQGYYFSKPMSSNDTTKFLKYEKFNLGE
jgi:EAL domain-containing protein (putative c-di-GMP-specific phosphodiesterase class I)